MMIFGETLDTPYQRKVYEERIKKYGLHPTCVGCAKASQCGNAAYPGYEFTCNVREVAGAPDHEGSGDSLPPSAPRKKNKKYRGGW